MRYIQKKINNSNQVWNQNTHLPNFCQILKKAFMFISRRENWKLKHTVQTPIKELFAYRPPELNKTTRRDNSGDH